MTFYPRKQHFTRANRRNIRATHLTTRANDISLAQKTKTPAQTVLHPRKPFCKPRKQHFTRAANISLAQRAFHIARAVFQLNQRTLSDESGKYLLISGEVIQK
jgi:hypothetical protein